MTPNLDWAESTLISMFHHHVPLAPQNPSKVPLGTYKIACNVFSQPTIMCSLYNDTTGQLTIQLVQNLPLTLKQKFCFGLARPGQNGTLFVKSTGGFAQGDWSPCKGHQLL